MLHPATVLLLWGGYAILLQRLGTDALFTLVVLCGVSAVLAAVYAGKRMISLLVRSRWLLFSVGVLFVFATPGEYLPGMGGQFGISVEGLVSGFVHLIRLLSLLLGLALVHEWLGNEGIVSGLYWILRPFPWRDATLVRLMLILEDADSRPAHVASAQPRASRWGRWFDELSIDMGTDHADSRASDHPSVCRVAAGIFSWRDGVLILLLLMVVMFDWLSLYPA